MSASKRPKLDFSSMVAGSREVVTDVKAMNGIVSEITSKVNKYQSEHMDGYRRLVEMSTDYTAEVLLVCRLGLEGLDCLRSAFQLVPKQYVDKRFEIITRIVNKVLDCNKKLPITIGECEVLGQISLKKVSSFMKRQCPTTAYDEELWELTNECGNLGYTSFLGPPTMVCLKPSCDKQPLRNYSSPTKITVYDMSGPRPASKITLRCSKCKANYNYSMFGNKTLSGERYYDEEREYIEASDVVFVNREVHQLFATLSVHCWVSFSGFAESLYECWHDRLSEEKFKVLTKRGFSVEFTRKHVSNMFYTAEMESELSEGVHLRKEVTFFKSNRDRDSLMSKIEESRVFSPYHHDQLPTCQDKGCEQCWSFDGNWKLGFTHCMYPVTTKLEGLQQLKYPDVCTDEPKYGKAFCEHHCATAVKNSIPCDLKEYLKFKAGSFVQPDSLSTSHHTVARSQGTEDFIKQNPSVLDDCEVQSDLDTTCQKDTGEKSRLQLWSRGHFFIVRPCGHIDQWKPLYRSESPSQVFVIVISWLLDVLKEREESKWKEVILCYDNMCHLDALKVSQKDLPLDAPYNKMWKKVTKIIDSLHIKNHTDDKCLATYHPKQVKDVHPTYNLMCAEQVFSWLSRYKRITSSMNKTHHCFFIHRIVVRRNRYTSICNRINRSALLPSVH